MVIEKKLLPEKERKIKPEVSELVFGKYMSDHMFKLEYTAGKGWHSARIEPYGPLHLEPAALVFHYAQEAFEGLKAYRGQNGGVYMFRPGANVARMNSSCRRLCMPEIPEDVFLEGMLELVKIDQEWIPRGKDTSLYVRPTIIATEPTLGVKVSREYLFFIIVGPVGAYYPEGFNPVKIYVEEKYVRAAPGGLGAIKAGANYAASLLAAEEAHAKGYTQVLWLDAVSRKFMEEVGTMNMFFVVDNIVITAPLDGTILPGITRDSVITLCRHWGLTVEERYLSVDELLHAQKTGALTEAFGTGTAAVISPVASFALQGDTYAVGSGGTGPLAAKLYDEIIGIQLGARPDIFNWLVKVA